MFDNLKRKQATGKTVLSKLHQFKFGGLEKWKKYVTWKKLHRKWPGSSFRREPFVPGIFPGCCCLKYNKTNVRKVLHMDLWETAYVFFIGTFGIRVEMSDPEHFLRRRIQNDDVQAATSFIQIPTHNAKNTQSYSIFNNALISAPIIYVPNFESWFHLLELLCIFHFPTGLQRFQFTKFLGSWH